MEQIIGKLSEIETTAETIMRDALQKKKALSAEMERQSKEFDTQLEKQTLSQLDAYYAKNHERLSREIFEKIIQEEVM